MGKNIAQLKSPSLRKCRYIKCDYYYFGYKHQRYCCKECKRLAGILKSIEYQKTWRKNNVEDVRQYHRNRYHTVPMSDDRKKKQRGHNRTYHDKNREAMNKERKERYYEVKSDTNLWKIHTTNKAIYYREKCLKNKNLTDGKIEKYKKEIEELEKSKKMNRNNV